MDTSRIEQIPAVKAIGLKALYLHQAIYERTDGPLGTTCSARAACCCAPPARRPG